MGRKKNRVCPVEKAAGLDNRIRRWLQNPQKILRPYIEEGMSVLDVGCGPGFFTVDIAQMVGPSGRVIASDLQEGMLQKVRDKIRGSGLEKRITLHKCESNTIGLTDRVDFVLLFYIVHEVPDAGAFLHEIESILHPNGKILLVEPPFHVSKKAFEKMVQKARDNGLAEIERPELFMSKAVILKKT